MGVRMLVATICIGVVSCCALSLESELVLEGASRNFVDGESRGLQAGLHMVPSAILQFPHRTGKGQPFGHDFGSRLEPLGYNFGAPWESFRVVILSPISVIKTMTGNRPRCINLLEKPKSRHQNDDRNRG